jgi:uncharacterized tellurite resistance protein B-like protein
MTSRASESCSHGGVPASRRFRGRRICSRSGRLFPYAVFVNEPPEWQKLTHDERMVFAGLIRVLVRMDGTFSTDEVAAVQRVAKSLGTREFWSAMTESQSAMPTVDDVVASVVQVKDPRTRTWMFAMLVEVANVDGFDPSEQQMLTWLGKTWQVDPALIP